LDECLETFSIRYRPYAGTVVLVVSGAGSNTTGNDVLGLNYLSYHTQSLGVVCPDYFMDQTLGGSDVIVKEDPPTLPLVFGTFGHEDSYHKSVSVDFPKHNNQLCPRTYSGVPDYRPAEVPAVQGCLLRVRGSTCRLGYNVVFFVIVSVSLAIKLILLVLAICVVRERPILTVGEAIAEYLENEDLNTAGCSLEWTKKNGLRCTGPVETYHSQAQNINSRGQPDISWERPHRRSWLKFWPSNPWREVWPSKEAARNASVPKWDIINYSAGIKSWERGWWLLLHACTLGVSAGIFTSIARQSGWVVLPSHPR